MKIYPTNATGGGAVGASVGGATVTGIGAHMSDFGQHSILKNVSFASWRLNGSSLHT